ncbi:MAG: zinc ribbon domain-containing protein [Chloroflexota bacterium]
MPVYQYACQDCGHAFEKRLRMAQAGEPQVCPSCQSQQTRKRIGAIAVGGASVTAPTMAAPPVKSPFS